MKMKYNLLPVIVFVGLCCSLVRAADNTTQKAEPIKEQDVITTTTTAPLPKVDILKSDLCKKCSCLSSPVSQIDCSNKKMNSLFSDEEWATLKNGDITFDIIKFEHNNITKITGFPNYTTKSLYLGFNQIKSIAKGAFANLTELAKLDLSHNKLNTKTLGPDAFQGVYSAHDYEPLGKMVELDIGHNEIHSLNSDLFEHLPQLESLILSGNTFQVIDQNTVAAITGLSYLKTLDMSFMELEELPDNLLHGPRDLETIILSGNLFDELPDDLDLAPNLRVLILDENPIADLIGENIFPNLPYLTYLSMAYMPELKEIGPGAFSELQNLTTLILSSNPKLSKIDVKAFAKNTTNPEILSYPPLEKLYIHNNNLSTLERGMLERWDKITDLDLRYNYWTCDCSNRWLIEVLMIQINNTQPIWTQDVNCYQPNAYRSVPLLQLSLPEARLQCSIETTSTSNLFLVGLLVGMLMCIPIILGSITVWRRGCFGLNRDRLAANRSLYNRANFSDELHI
ncbi:leucine-rich repeat-containing protein 15 [Anastrepha ludens]|uniref:leucine-rich repeat-containing protein 15 n=1 Tax=Anastrepha ludens TaxID=28586 RepID=UPI0023AEBA51|nr:leucine-rich repeat-containing protein 15 [Anastrepha ludens]XP_053951292.1 leucine-rich repeat-containing protein 15 [Anastrepha ludens]XP_053951293.1 leucine-rich repeat-containing protein 15 [Anastrepha ludens]